MTFILVFELWTNLAIQNYYIKLEENPNIIESINITKTTKKENNMIKLIKEKDRQ